MHRKLNINMVMKRFLLIGIMILAAVTGFAQDANTVKTLKEQQKVLDLTSKLNKLQLDYEKEKATYNDITQAAAEANANADIATTGFNTTDAKNTVKDAKDTIKALKEAKKANKKLKKVQQKLSKMEKKIANLQNRLDNLNKGIEFVNQ